MLPAVHRRRCSTSPTTSSTGTVVPPPRVVRYDGDDPYLVVAADKGTATFSDIANEIALARGFWLGDAFASGGSAGYDHKEMGITARGAWESVRRHFRHLGIDPDRDDFTVVGIGDMSGDVFGNGMLLSQHIRLVAAFDHRHVFLDPDPDRRSVVRRSASGCSSCPARRGPTTTRALHLAGRRRVPAHREVDRDHDRGARPARHRPTASPRCTPAELIRAILRAPGRPALQRRHRHLREGAHRDATPTSATRRTTRCASTAPSCAAESVGEGGNLGFTQLGRVEYALARRAASTPTRSTTARASTRPTTR